jgi:hypothetical protein
VCSSDLTAAFLYQVVLLTLTVRNVRSFIKIRISTACANGGGKWKF